MGDRRFLKETIPSGTIGAEVGVWKGQFSQLLLSTSPEKLHLIDPWEFRPEYPKRLYGGRAARSQEDMDKLHQGVIKKFALTDSVQIHRLRLEDAVIEFEDEYFDWVYIDGDHSEAGKDISLLLPKVKKQGLIMGDDYNWPEVSRDVTKAIREGLELIEIKNHQFILRKNDENR